MIILVMLPLKMVEEAKAVLEDLVVLAVQIFQIFLKIFLVTLGEVEEEILEGGTQTIEVQI